MEFETRKINLEGHTPDGIPVSNHCTTCELQEYSKRYSIENLMEPVRLQGYCRKTGKENDYVVYGCKDWVGKTPNLPNTIRQVLIVDGQVISEIIK